MSIAISPSSNALSPIDDWRFFGDKMPSLPQILDIADTERWGVSTFRTFPETREDLKAHEDSFVIARIDANRMDLVQYALKIGYLLCDTLTYWKGSDIAQAPLPAGYWGRVKTDRDKLLLEQFAYREFKDYAGHYSNDPRTRDKAREVYKQWASQGPGVIIEHERCEFPHVHRTPVAFGLFKSPCELSLAAVDKGHSGKGLYAAIVRWCASWGLDQGIPTIEISTQVTNLAVQSVWAKMGLKPYKHVYTLHRWP